MRIVLLLLLVVSPTLTQQQFTTIPTSAYFIHPPKTTYPHSPAQLFTSQYPTYNSNSIIEFKPVVPQSIQTEGFGGFNLRNPISVRFEYDNVQNNVLLTPWLLVMEAEPTQGGGAYKILQSMDVNFESSHAASLSISAQFAPSISSVHVTNLKYEILKIPSGELKTASELLSSIEIVYIWSRGSGDALDGDLVGGVGITLWAGLVFMFLVLGRSCLQG
ncbi:hypothetical protein ScalyP_jg6596 [Parmales sp. scaly parma]|nr:hypothetical protein ScalyP_jg6596 [Parmales sp. scaly parma]